MGRILSQRFLLLVALTAAGLVLGRSGTAAQPGFPASAIDAWKAADQSLADQLALVVSTEFSLRRGDKTGTRQELFASYDGSALHEVTRSDNVVREVFGPGKHFVVFRAAADTDGSWLLNGNETFELPEPHADGNAGIPLNEGSNPALAKYRLVRNEMESYANARFRYGALRLDELLPAEKVTEMPEKNGLKIFGFETGPDDLLSNVRGTVVLDPANNWTILKLQFEMQKDGAWTRRETREIVVPVDHPEWTRLLISSEQLENGAWVCVEKYTHQISTPASPPGKSAYTLAFYGITLDESPVVSGNRMWLWAVAIGALLIGGAIWLKSRAADSKRIAS